MAEAEKFRRTGVIARKVGMMRVFAEDGAHVPCTVLDLEGCQVVGRRTVEAEEFKNAAGEAGDATVDTLARQARTDGDLLAAELGTETLATLTARHGYVASSPFASRLALAARLAATSLTPRLLTVDGDQPWDTHTSQSTNTASAAKGLYASTADLATNLAAFRTDLLARGM
ncbi:MAG TPA: DUF1501 domain-containing protein, partial [Terricaulis sp.]|nr:DUF1501 domain-containing protein [Terricaulis sp.]